MLPPGTKGSRPFSLVPKIPVRTGTSSSSYLYFWDGPMVYFLLVNYSIHTPNLRKKDYKFQWNVIRSCSLWPYYRYMQGCNKLLLLYISIRITKCIVSRWGMPIKNNIYFKPYVGKRIQSKEMRKWWARMNKSSGSRKGPLWYCCSKGGKEPRNLKGWG